MKEEMDQRIACLWGFDPGQGFSVEEKEVLFFTAREEAFWSGEPYIYYDGKNCDLESFAHLCKKRAFATLIHYISPDFSSEEVARAKEWIQRCQEIHWHACLVASEWQDFRIGIFRNLLANRTKLQDPVAWEGMKGLAKGVPAFICGAGPSLKQDKEWLTSCSQKGLVFAGGAALGFLTHAGFPVHIALGMDPDPNTKRVQMQGSFEAPFFFLGRFHRECLHAIHGALFQVPPNAESALEEWAEGRSWDVGWTVVTFACALAVHLGCNPVFLLGADFAALCEDSLYMEGVDGGGQKGVAFIGQGDKVLCTKKEWVIAARWIEDFIRQHQETTIYTTSSIEGPLQKIATGSLQEFLQRNDTLDIDVEGVVHTMRSLWQQTSLKGAWEEEVEKSLRACIMQVERILELFAKEHPRSPVDRGAFILAVLDIDEEPFYQRLLKPLWEVWQHPLQRVVHDLTGLELQKWLLFQRVLREYMEVLCQI